MGRSGLAYFIKVSRSIIEVSASNITVIIKTVYKGYIVLRGMTICM